MCSNSNDWYPVPAPPAKKSNSNNNKKYDNKIETIQKTTPQKKKTQNAAKIRKPAKNQEHINIHRITILNRQNSDICINSNTNKYRPSRLGL